MKMEKCSQLMYMNNKDLVQFERFSWDISVQGNIDQIEYAGLKLIWSFILILTVNIWILNLFQYENKISNAYLLQF